MSAKKMKNVPEVRIITDVPAAKKMFDSVTPEHAFAALLIAMETEFFMSSDSKWLMHHKMLCMLREAGYDDDALLEFAEGLDEIRAKFRKTNSFMG